MSGWVGAQHSKKNWTQIFRCAPLRLVPSSILCHRYRTAKYVDIVPRFNERFLLSFSDLTHFLSVDDELNVIPFTSNVAKIEPVDSSVHDGFKTEAEKEVWCRLHCRTPDMPSYHRHGSGFELCVACLNSFT